MQQFAHFIGVDQCRFCFLNGIHRIMSPLRPCVVCLGFFLVSNRNNSQPRLPSPIAVWRVLGERGGNSLHGESPPLDRHADTPGDPKLDNGDKSHSLLSYSMVL
jgi:hypothetical protein